MTFYDNEMNLFEYFESAVSAFAGFMWGPPLLILLLGGGIYLSLIHI